MAVSSSGRSEIEEVSNVKSSRPENNVELPASVYKDLAEAFKMFDINGDGKISRVELETILRSLGETLTETELDQMIKDVDADGDGEIDLQEFINLNCDPRRATVSSKTGEDEEADAAALQSAFDVFDSDKDGFISAGELHRVLSSLGDDHISLDDCRYMISCVDADGDQLVDFKEFQTLMTGSLSTGHSALGTAHLSI